MTEVTVPETPRSQELIAAAEVLLDRAGKFQVIQTPAEAELAAEYRARVNQQIKDLDAERLDMGAGLRETLLKINTRFNAPIEALKAKLGIVDLALKGYMAQQRALAEAAERARREQEEARKREEARRLAEIEAARKAAEEANLPPPEPEPLPAPIPDPVPEFTTTRIEGSYGSKVGTREVWKYRIADIKKVPEQFLVPVEDRVNKGALNALARSMKDKAKVKGIEFYADETLQSRVS
jgi:hypothetical protein